MTFNTIEQRQIDIYVLWALFIRADRDMPPIDLDGLHGLLKDKGYSKTRVTHSLRSLGSIDCAGSSDGKFSITPKGIDWVEDTFEYVRNSRTNFTFYHKHDHSVIGVLQRDLKARKATKKDPSDTAFWTKVGAVAGVAAVAVSIVLWKFS